MKFSIRWVLILSFLGVIWVTHFITTTSAYVSSEKVLLGHARDIMENIAEFAMSKSQDHLALAQGAAHLTKRLLRANVVGSGAHQVHLLEQYFYDQLAIYPHFAGIYLGLPNGDFFYVSRNRDRAGCAFRTKIIHHRGGSRETQLIWRDKDFKEIAREKDPDDTYDPRLRPWYQKALKEKRIVWTDPYIFYTSQMLGITISGPNYDKSGVLEGVVGVDIEIDQLSVFIGKLRIGKSGKAFMLNRNEDVVAFPDPEKLKFSGADSPGQSRLVKINELDDQLCQKAFSAIDWERGKDGRIILDHPLFAKFEYNGNTYHTMFTPFSAREWPWIIGIYLPEDDYLGGIKENRLFNIFMSIIISILATLSGLYFARTIIRPIANLEREAQAVKNRDYHSRFNTHSAYREIQETADSFKLMKEAVRKSEEKLKKYRDHLEDLVAERTAEIVVANRKLKQEIEGRIQAEETLGKSKEDLRQARRFARNLIDSSIDMIVAVDLDRKIIEFNRAAEKTFGYAAQEVLGKHVDILYADVDNGSKIHKNTIKTEGYVGEIENRRKDGRIFTSFISTAILRDTAGKPIGVMGISRDITDIKKAEEEKIRLQNQLLHAQKLESIGTIASGVSHNFRNILSGISVNVQLLRMKYGENKEIKDISDRAGNYVKMGGRLVESLTRFSRKQAGDTFESLDLADVLRKTCDLIRESFDKMIDIHVDLPGTLPVLGDDSSLRQVFMNLFTNARDAMPEGGILSIKARRTKDKVEVIVSDTGCGMDAETQKKCFDPFFTTKDVSRGTGLGLSTTYGIVKEHKGIIHVHSEVGTGTTFKLIFPLDFSDKQVEESKTPEIVRGNGMKILVVDDEVALLEPMEDLLEALGYRADSVTSGEEAVVRYKSWRPDAVLLDRNMPGMDGITCARKIIDYDPDAKIIILSGYDENGPDGIGLRNGELIAGYLTKPIDVVVLSHALAKVFG